MNRSFSVPEKLLFGAVTVFLLFGNSLRILPLPTGFGNVNFGELVVYFVAFVLFPRNVLNVFKSTIGATLLVATIFSVFVGVYKWGADVSAISYSVRLVAQLMLAFLLAHILAKKAGLDFESILNKYVLTYVAIAIAALALFFIFPESEVLWATLATIGVEFGGDPHIGRLVSLYFDPNFYAAIIVLPIVVSLHLYSIDWRSKFLVYACILMATLFLTVSRSGIALLVVTILLQFSGGNTALGRLKISKRVLKALVVSTVLMGVAAILSIEQIERLLNRMAAGVQDDSSTARYDSFQVGMQLLGSEPVLGYGYNFSLSFVQNSGRLGLDSSIQMVLLSYGVLPALILFTIIVLQFFVINQRLKKYKQGSTGAFYRAWRLFLIYIFWSLAWASNFNQVLFYPFWIIPVFAFVFYFEMAAQGRVAGIDRPVPSQ